MVARLPETGIDVEDGESYSIKVGLIAKGSDLDIHSEGACIWIRDGIIESIETRGSCTNKSLGGDHIIAVPQPANAHIHSGDSAFPEYGVELDLKTLVSYPSGLKHKLLENLGVDELEQAILRTYRSAWMQGIGALADFREGGGVGCMAAKRALSRAPQGLEVVVLGRPGPEWPRGCDGLGISSTLDYDEETLTSIRRGWRVAMAHIAEDRESRVAGDLELAIKHGFTGVIHGVYLSREDLDLLSDKRMYLVLCIRSNMWHGIGIPPVRDVIESGVRIALGSDNAAWMPLDIWEEARMLLYVLRLNNMKSESLIDKVLKALFVEGYNALGIKEKIVDEGSRADLLLFADHDETIIRAHSKKVAILKRLGRNNLLARIDEGELSFL